MQGSRAIRQAPLGNWLLGLAGGVSVGALGAFCDSLVGQPQMLHQDLFDSPAEPVLAGRNTGDGVGRFGQVRAFCFSTARTEHPHLRCFSTAALCRHHHTSHSQVYNHTHRSSTTSQLQSFDPGNIIWSLVLVLQMPSGHRQYL